MAEETTGVEEITSEPELSVTDAVENIGDTVVQTIQVELKY